MGATLTRMSRIAGLLAIALGIAGCATVQTWGDGAQRVTIPQIAAGKPFPNDPDVTGYLFKPEGKGPFPAVILLHGCGGLQLNTSHRAGWVTGTQAARWYTERGYVALIVDSFAPRGVETVCDDSGRVGVARRVWDAASAARYLAGLDYINKDRIILDGRSHGGWTVLSALNAAPSEVPFRFAAGVAWYPWCDATTRGFQSPVLILIGEADDWTPARRCSVLLDELRAARRDRNVRLKIYPGVYHSYDAPFPHRYGPGGHILAHNRAATEDSWKQIEAFLKTRGQ